MKQLWVLATLLMAFGASTISFLPSYAHAASSKKITEVRYIGFVAVAPRELEGSIPVSPGDVWREGLEGVTKTAIQGYFEKRGFYNSRVNIRFVPSSKDENGLVMMILVSEGRPCTVRTLWIDDPPGFKSKSSRLRFKSAMADVVRVSPGDRYDEEILADRLRILREWLVSNDFIMAATDSVRLTYNEDRTAVDLVLAVNYGERVTFGYRGNTVFTKGELNEFVAQLRTTGLGKDYAGVIQRRFIEEYHERAYNGIQIEQLAGEREFSKHITFVFREGVRTKLVEMKWEGLTDENRAVAKRVFGDGAARLVQRGYYVDKDVEKGVLLVIEDLKARGYLSSKVLALSTRPVKNRFNEPRVQVTALLSEGERTMVGKIQLRGFEHFPRERVLDALGVSEEEPFNPFALEEGLQRLRSLYLAEGYLNFKVATKDDGIVNFIENNRTANIELEVVEGARIRIGDVRIKGLQKTREYVVRRELTVHPDQWWLANVLQETETNLLKLGLFSEVKLLPIASARGSEFRDMVIELQETEPGILEAGPGFRSDLGIRAFARVSYNNLLGKNWIGALSAEGNRRVDNEYRFIEYKFDATFIEPRFLGTRNLYSIGLSTRKQRFPPDFNAVTTTFTTGFERKIIKIFTTRLSYKLERIRQFDVFLDNHFSAIDNRSMLIGSIVPAITLDTRDSPFTTTSGWLATASLEYAHPHLSGQSIGDFGAPGYQKWNMSVHRYTSLTKDITWSKVIAGGFARSSIAGREIPLIKLFRLGGYSTIRGFPEDSINVDALNVLGTLSYLNLRTQFDLPLIGALKVAPFLDAGNLYIDAFRGHPFFRAGAGVGLHYMTPVGPINLDWGHKINPVSGESPNQLHFSVGLI